MFTIYRGLYFGLYDTASEELQWQHPVAKWCIAAATTTVAGLPVYPLDTVRRRMMMQAGRDASKVQYVGFRACTLAIWRGESFRGFYKGGVSNLFRSVGGSVVLVVYDKLKTLY